MQKIFLTGATGTMGSATLRELLRRPDMFQIKVLARPSGKNRRILGELERRGAVSVVWGDLLDPDAISRGISDADIVLHVGGMVSPAADRMPELTWKVNTGSMRLIADAVRSRPGSEEVAVVYIGSVSQYGPRSEPFHWGRAGDPMVAAKGDWYALSKIAAERILAESGLKKWVSLRQTGILCPEILFKGSDPISFHVPLRGVLEWTTAEESGRLLASLCEKAPSLPASFWRRFYNIGSGEAFRMSNYDFERRLMSALSSPPPEKVFDTRWFALGNFHGIWYTDSDRLEELFHFRSGTDADTYFHTMASRLPFWFRLAGIVPPALIKAMMKRVALKKPLGTLALERDGDTARTNAFFGSQQRRDAIPGWDRFDLSDPSRTPKLLDHGYDEDKPEALLSIHDMRQAAAFRGGRSLSEKMDTGDLYTPLEWECACGHRFTATPATVILGGHWCPECFPPEWDYEAEARVNPFLAQVVRPD